MMAVPESNNKPTEEKAAQEKNGEFRIIGLLYRKRYLILGFTVIVSLIVAGWSLTMENVYSSTATIIIRGTEELLPGDIQPLDVQALRSLALSTKVKASTYNKLKQDGILPENVPYPAFQNRLSLSVERSATREGGLLPMLKLTAEASTPQLAEAIANTWADQVTSHAQSIYQSGVDEYSNFIDNMAKQAEKSLMQSEDAYTSAILNADLETKKARLAENRLEYTTMYKKFVNLQSSAKTTETLLNEVNKRVLNQEIDGAWIGDIARENPARIDELKEWDDLSSNTRLIIRTVANLEQFERKLSDFEQESELAYKQITLENLKTQLQQISTSIIDTQNELTKAEKSHQALAERIKETPPKITLNKAITDDVLWEQFLNAEREENKIETPLKTEVSNPTYEILQQQEAVLYADMIGYKNRLQYLNLKTNDIRTSINKISKDVTALQNTQQALQSALEKESQIFDYLQAEYNKDRRKRNQLKKQYEQAREKIETINEILSELEQDSDRLEAQIERSEDRIAARQRDVESRTEVRTSIAQKANEANLLQITVKNASRSSTAVLYEAEANPNPVAPRRSRMVLVAALGAFFLACFMIVVNDRLAQITV